MEADCSRMGDEILSRGAMKRISPHLYVAGKFCNARTGDLVNFKKATNKKGRDVYKLTISSLKRLTKRIELVSDWL